MVNLLTQMIYAHGEMFIITKIEDNTVYLENYHDPSYKADIHFKDLKEILDTTENKNLRESFNSKYPEVFV